MGLVMIGVAVTGFATSLRITRTPPSGTQAPFDLNPFGEVITGTRHLLRDRPMWLAVVGISYFWFLGALFQMDLLLFGSEVLKLTDLKIGLMVTCLAMGIGAGSLLAGKLSGDRVELGLVPLGSIFMGLSCLAVYPVRSFAGSIVALVLLGLSSGLFIVPLNAYLQQRSESGEKGRIIATNNFYNTLGLLLASATLTGLHDRLHVSADKLILWFGIVTLVATVYITSLIPEFLVRFLLWIAMHNIYKIRVAGQENVPFRGPALLVANHTTHIDGFLINACMQRFVRFMVWKPFYANPFLRRFLDINRCIPVGTSGPRDLIKSMQAARAELKRGHVVCIFAEGSISRTGNLLPFKRGMERIVDGLDVPVIPVHLSGLWGSIFSFEQGRFFWKWPKRIPYPVTVSFGPPMPSTSSTHDVRQAIAELASTAVMDRKHPDDLLPLRFIRNARKNWGKFAMADSTGRELTYGRALTASLLMADWVKKHYSQDAMIGLLLPPSVGGALANIGIAIAGKTPVNLNFTAGKDAMASAIAQCDIRMIVTSKVFLAKAKIDAMEGMVFIEDALSSANGFVKFLALVKARFAPVNMLLKRDTPDSLATVIFSSGSTGEPKGVMLSHYNIISNIEAMAQVFSVGSNDRIIGVLPFFHFFGFTVTLWFPPIAGCGVAYHPNPTGENPKVAETIGEMIEQAFSIDRLEGYGFAEMSAVVAVNVPNFEAGKDTQIGNKLGTVGHPLPGVAVRVVNPETLEPLPPHQEGLLLVKGANRMLGYLGDPGRTAEAMVDGWYRTGDIGTVDDEGFVRITDRLSRFSKIGGEMVPHLKIEEEIYRLLGDSACVVTGVPDARKGERLAVLYANTEIAPDELWRRLSETDLPRLWLPKREDMHQVEALPTLGTGKVDLRAVKEYSARFHVGVNL